MFSLSRRATRNGILSCFGFVLTLSPAGNAAAPQTQLDRHSAAGLGAFKADTAAPAELADKQYLFQLDADAMRSVLSAAPMEFSAGAAQAAVEVSLPLADGSLARFRMVESPILTPAMTTQRPDIRTYAGQCIDDPTTTARMGLAGDEFHAVILAPDRTTLVQQVRGSVGTYRSLQYEGESRERFTCGVDVGSAPSGGGIAAAPSGATLTTYVLAVSLTGEYCTLFGGTGPAINQATATVNTLNAIYDRECTTRFTVMFDAYADPATDPFTDGTTVNGTLLDENDASLDAVFGEANYDIGHVFTVIPSGTRGLAGCCACESDKGRGATGGADPTNAIFNIDGVPHEIGHQMTAAHIYNSTAGGCVERSAGSAYEIGSGSTIMSYTVAGCTGEDIPGSADNYFHGHNFDQITNWRDGGGACGATTATGNTPPTVDAGPDYTIPQGTPFKLTAAGGDADGDAITYCWEQFDLGDPSPPIDPTNPNAGPLFRSLPPTTSNVRFCPNLPDLIAGNPTPFEVLPLADRVLTWRCTVRDNRANGGGINNDAMIITVAGDPFFVTFPNGGETLCAGNATTVTWNVGGGDDVDTVNILLSTDGGVTFPITLASDVPNDGAHDVTIPCDATTTQGRILIEAVGNIFFDISDGNFAIANAPPAIGCEVTNVIQPVEVDETCQAVVSFAATITDDCCLDEASLNLNVAAVVTTNNATIQEIDASLTVLSDTKITITRKYRVSQLTGCPATVQITVNATDCCGVAANPCVDSVDVVDLIPPQITCPPDITLERGDKLCAADVQNWLDSATATDNCDGNVDIVDDSAANGFACGFPYGSSTLVTWTATDDCGNTAQCSATITIKPAPLGAPSQKGSILVFPNLEAKWNADGSALRQDTFITLNNDQNEAVHLNLFFVNGDPNTASEPGWNAQKVDIDLTKNQPIFFSAATGLPAGISGFTLLDPGPPPGRVDPEDPTGRVLRGFLVVVAIDELGHEIRWNHLYGGATIVDYAQGRSWDYEAWAFQNRCVDEGLEPYDCTLFDANGVCCAAQVIPGNLDFDAFQFDFAPNQLLHQFVAANATAFSGGGRLVVHDTDLTLMVLSTDLRQDNAGPVTTKADLLVWNGNEISFAATRCFTCWDQTLLSNYGGIFLRNNLQTDAGRVRINGNASTQCPDSVSAALLGVANKVLTINGGAGNAFGGSHLQGSGTQNATIKFDPLPPPEENLNGGK